jgi:hypothetical protein
MEFLLCVCVCVCVWGGGGGRWLIYLFTVTNMEGISVLKDITLMEENKLICFKL